MKTLLLCFCVVFAFAEFREYFQKIDENAGILDLQNPFFTDDMSDKLHLQAIFTDRVKINEQWYQKDESVSGARIVAILAREGSVLLEKDTQQFYLNLKRANHKIHIR